MPIIVGGDTNVYTLGDICLALDNRSINNSFWPITALFDLINVDVLFDWLKNGFTIFYYLIKMLISTFLSDKDNKKWNM